MQALPLLNFTKKTNAANGVCFLIRIRDDIRQAIIGEGKEDAMINKRTPPHIIGVACFFCAIRV